MGANAEVAQAASGLDAEILHVKAPGKSVDLPALEVVHCDYTSESALLELVETHLRNRSPTAVVSLTEMGLEPAALASEALGTPALPSAVVRRTRDKLAMRQRLAERAPEVTVAYACLSDAEAVSRLFEGGSRVVVKPRRGSGSEEIVVLGSYAELSTPAEPEAYLAEQYADGLEFSVETLSRGGTHRTVGVAEKVTGTGFVELAHVMPPPSLGPDQLLSVTEAVAAALDALDITDGPSHTEVKYDGSRALVIETHNRQGGDGIADLVRLTTGIDWRQAAVSWPLRDPSAGPHLEPRESPTAVAAASVFLTADPGVVVSVGERPALPDAQYQDWQLDVSLGDTVGPLRSSDDRLGRAIITATSSHTCSAMAAQLGSASVITTVPVDPSTSHSHKELARG